MSGMKYVILFIALSAGMAIFVACKKTSGGAKSMLEAKWKSEQAGYDANGNKAIDSNELHTTDSLNEYRLFNSDGSGAEIGVNFGNYPLPFYWALSTDNQYLRITDTSNNATIFHIDVLTNTQLTLRDTAGGVAVWNVYKKQ
jgi:DNA-binding beta-propeller fold protein YncE